MITIIYSKNGVAVSDFELEAFVQNAIHVSKNCDVVYNISTENPVHAIRLAIVDGRINCENVVFSFDCKAIKVNKYGTLVGWPKGFADKSCDYSESILRAAMKMRKMERMGKKIEEKLNNA